MTSQKDSPAFLDGKYISGSLSKDKLIKRLVKVSDHLSQLEQGIETKTIDHTAAALIQEPIIKNKEKDVRLLCACCLADIIRIYAPEPPYNEKQLRDIFRLFIEQLKGLENEDDSSFQRRYYLLERLSMVKAFILLGSLEDEGEEDLKCSLFNTLFSVANSFQTNAPATTSKKTTKQPTKDPTQIISLILDVMISFIEEIEHISDSFLILILERLVKDKKDSPYSYKLTRKLINACATHLEGPIAQVIINETDPEFKENVHSIIYELNKISPSLLVQILPILERDIKSEDESIRLKTTETLGKMFAPRNSTLSETSPALFNAFLGRFNDVSSQIRFIMIEFSQHYLLNHQSHITDINEKLIERIQDHEEENRKMVVRVVWNVLIENPDNISDQLLIKVTDRTLDKKESVRHESIRGFSKLCAHVCDKYGNEILTNSPKFSLLPSKIMKTYLLPDHRDRLFIEMELSQTILPQDLKQRVDRFIHFFMSLDADAKRGFFAFIKEKFGTQKEFLNFLERKKNGEDSEIKTSMNILSTTFNLKLDVLKKIKALKDKNVVKNLENLVSPQSDYETICLAKKYFLDKKDDTLKDLANNLAMTVITRDILSDIFETITSKIESRENFTPLLDLVVELSNVCPDIFIDSLDSLISLLSERDEELIKNTLIMLSHVGSLVSEISKDTIKSIKQDLKSLCVSGSPSLAKHAVRAMVALFTSESTFEQLLKDLMNHLKLKEKNLSSVLTSIAQLALSFPQVFEKKKSEIEDFIQKLFDSNVGSKKRSKDDPNPKVIALKIYVNFACAIESVDDSETHTQDLILFLFKILKNGGEISSAEDSSDLDKQQLRLAAASGILKLARYPKYNKLLKNSPQHFHLLAWTAQDSSLFVKTGFVNKLSKGLKTLQLSVNYLSIFALYAIDTNREVHSLARKYLDHNITLRRNIKTTDNTSTSLLQLQLPEQALCWLIHLISHHPSLKYDINQLKVQAPIYLNFFLEPLFHKRSQENFTFLTNLLEGLKRTKDKIDPELPNIRLVAEIAIRLVKERSDKTAWKYTGSKSSDIFVPMELFTLPQDGEMKEIEESNKDFALAVSTVSLHPEKEKLIEKETDETKHKKKSSKKKVQKSASENESEGEKEYSPTKKFPKKPKSTRAKKTKSKSSEEKEEEDVLEIEEGEPQKPKEKQKSKKKETPKEKPKQKSKEKPKSTKKTQKKRKSPKSEEDSQEEEEEKENRNPKNNKKKRRKISSEEEVSV